MRLAAEVLSLDTYEIRLISESRMGQVWKTRVGWIAPSPLV
jgi:hypothetical protein